MDNLNDLKVKGEAPTWMSEISFITISNGYLLENETPRGLYNRLAKSAASYYKDKDKWEKKFFDAMWNNWLCPSTPVLSNLGTSRALPISCNGISPSDSIDSIFMKNHELAILSKNGAGVSIYCGNIRPRGTPINTNNGKSFGCVSWIKNYDTTVSSVSQGSRRGAASVYLPIDNLDFEEFLNIRRAVGDANTRCLNINHGVCISDKWMEEMLAGDVSKRKKWENLLKTRVETGQPYIMFSDTVNKNNPECYKANNLSVKMSNLCCLAGDTLVATKNGAMRIDALINKEVEIYDGKNWIKTNSFKLQGEDELIRIHTADGSYTDSNANHRWFVSKNYNDISRNKLHETFTKDLQIGQYLEYHREECHGTIEQKALYLNGFLVEDSIHMNDRAMLKKIVKIEKLIGKHKVYCPTIPTTGKFALANGLMTGNSEITLHTDDNTSFICCLSSLNLAKWDEWKDTDLVNIGIRFLDAILSEYIEKSEGISGLEPSRRSAILGRSVGLGTLAYHELLQQKNIPFDSFDAMQLNAEIFKTIRMRAEEETKLLAEELGEPQWCKGFNRRNTHLLALAPTVSNAIISSVDSSSIEPIASNIYSQQSAKGTFIRKNSNLEKLLEKKNKNTLDVWKSINEYSGSVQHLNFLSDHEKLVYLSAREINQFSIVRQAAQRQKYIDQSQSLNLFFASNASAKYIHDVHIEGYKLGVKTFYYFRSEGVLKADLANRDASECISCEG